MNEFMKTIINGLKTWTSSRIKNSRGNWNQNDPTADDYIKGRTHWACDGVLVDDTVIEIYDEYGYVEDAFTVDLIEGQSYTVIFNGIEYECICYDVDGCYGIGNGNIWDCDGGNNEPFLIANYYDITAIYTIEAGPHTLRILGEDVKKLDKKYLPSDIVKKEEFYDTIDMVYSDMPFDAIRYSSQTLSEARKTQARTNIGAGTSSFSGSYNDLTDKPILPGSYNDLTDKPILPEGTITRVLAKDEIEIGDVVYTVKDGTYIEHYTSDIYADNSNTVLSSNVYTSSFSPDGKLLVVGGHFSGHAKLYRVEDTTITYISDIYADNSNTVLDSWVNSITFSPDGKLLVVGGYFTGKAKVYSVEDTAVTYISDIYADNSNTVLDSLVNSITFSPDGKLLVLVGGFTGKAKVYSVEDTAVTYISDIYADNSNTVLSTVQGVHVNTSSFSPDGKLLVLGGDSSVRAKLYSVEDTTITYISDVYADNSNTNLSSGVYTSSFSPDGKLLVLGGRFNGYAKLYSVEGNNITYISNINNINAEHAGTGTSIVKTSSFSPDGKLLLFGCDFRSYSRMYAVDGTTITYIGTLYNPSNNGSVEHINSTVSTYSFSPDGKLLVVCGGFSSKAKVYSLSSLVSYPVNTTPWEHSEYDIGIAHTAANTNEIVSVSIMPEAYKIQSDWMNAKGLATEEYVNEQIDKAELILTSSTEGSTKQFKVTVDDTGTLSATEITS